MVSAFGMGTALRTQSGALGGVSLTASGGGWGSEDGSRNGIGKVGDASAPALGACTAAGSGTTAAASDLEGEGVPDVHQAVSSALAEEDRMAAPTSGRTSSLQAGQRTEATESAAAEESGCLQRGQK
jgi:hypothetical protein